jgi:hypothetical protein
VAKLKTIFHQWVAALCNLHKFRIKCKYHQTEDNPIFKAASYYHSMILLKRGMEQQGGITAESQAIILQV